MPQKDPPTVTRSDHISGDKSSFNLEAYLQRIGYTGTPAANIETLKAVQRLHPQAIPFENLNPLLGLPVRLDMHSLQQKMVENRRGGYCFEHNLLFYHVLKALGFSVIKLAGRVLWNKPDTSITSRTHMVLLISLDGKQYICDVGFGTSTPTGPLLLEPNLVQETPHESYRLLERPDHFLLQTNIKNEWKTVYRFTLRPQHFIDYKVANWYTSTHPDSHFVKKLSVGLAEPERRYALSNNRFSIHDQQEGTSKRKISDADQLYTILEETFNIDLTGLPEVKELLKQLAEGD